MLTPEGSAASSKIKQEKLPNNLTRHGVETIFRTNTAGQPHIMATAFERPKNILAHLIAQLKTVDADTVLIYTSDYGESLGEHGFYVHGTPKAIAPKQQREIPFLVWMSGGFKERRGESYADIIPSETFPHDFPFYSVMGAFGMRSEIYIPEYDIFKLKH